jgi:hypothetical protein
MTLLLMLLLKSLLVFMLSGAALLYLRRASASARHLVCLLTLCALLALPLFSLTLPGWHVAGLQEAPTPQQAATLPKREGAEFRAVQPPSAVPLAASADTAPLSDTAAPSEPPRLPASGGQALVPGGFLALYVLGVVLAGLRPLLGLWGIAHLRRACVSVTDAPTLSVSADCAAALRLSRLPLLCRADALVPMTWGWRRPIVLLPSGSETWPEEILRSVLLHEMAHIKRRDWTCHRLADITCALYWFHPFVWLTARRLRAESEIACDDLVLSSGVAAPDYARHLLEIAGALSHPLPSQSAIAMAQTSRIKGRITRILDKTRSRRAVTRRALLLAAVPAAAALIVLAVLRPSVKAQAAPAQTVAAPPPSVSTQLPSLSVTNMEVDGKMLLAGVTNANKPGGLWWSPTGTPLPTPVYDTAVNHSMNDTVQERRPDNTLIPTNNVIFAFRLPADAQGVTFQYKLPNTSSSSNGEWPGKSQSDAGHTENQMFASTGGARIVTAAFPATLKKTSLQVGIASGTWKTAVSAAVNSSGVNQGTSRSSSNGVDFILSQAVETAKGLLLTAATTSTDDARIVAIGSQGQPLLPRDIDGESVNNLDQITVHFSQPLSQIKAFRVETRPFQWIEFKDVALQPVK